MLEKKSIDNCAQSIQKSMKVIWQYEDCCIIRIEYSSYKYCFFKCTDFVYYIELGTEEFTK